MKKERPIVVKLRCLIKINTNKRDEQERKQSEEHFKSVLLKADSFEWHKLYYNNCILKDEDTEKYLLQGCLRM